MEKIWEILHKRINEILDENNWISFKNNEDKTIYNIISEFLSEFNSVNTIRRYKKILNEFLISYLKFNLLMDFAQIHPANMTNYCQEFINSKKKLDPENNNRLLNPNSINNTTYCIRSFFKYLIDRYNYPKNPLWRYKPLKTKDNSTTQSLSYLEVNSILNELKNDYLNYQGNAKKKLLKLRDYLIFCFLFMSLRRSEVVNLKYQDLNISDKFINVLQKWWSNKIIPIPESVINFLKIYTQSKELLWYKSDYIFSTIQNNSQKILNKPLSSQYIFNLVTKVCHKLWINKRITPHSFRKTFIELSLNKNENYNNISNATWHKTAQMIKYYDNRDKLKNNSINQFSDMF